MSFPRYERYTDSGVEWLGEVPSHWIIASLKRGFDVRLGKMLNTGPSSEDDRQLPYMRAANIQWSDVDTSDIKTMWFSINEIEQLRLVVGDLLVSEGGDVGRSTVWQGELDECYFQNSINRVRSKGNNLTRFLYYWVSALKVSGYIDNLCNKATIAHFTAEKVQAIPVPFPPASEQAAIAAFLDRETAKIDALIEEQKKLIELLKEKRQAVISHAVTKGLDPNVPMKDSGVEWLGEVPAHWELKLLKRAFRSIDYGISDALDVEGEIAVLRMGNIVDGEVRLDDLKYVNGVDFALLLQAGDLLFNRTNSLDLIGKVGFFKGVTDTPVSFASYLVRLRVTDSTNSRYMSYLLNTPGILGEARANALIPHSPSKSLILLSGSQYFRYKSWC